MPYGGEAAAPFPSRQFPGGIVPTAGPLAHSVNDLRLFMEAVIGGRPWKYDAAAKDLDWRDIRYGQAKTLTIGILAEDAEYPLMPPVRRAMSEAVDRLTKAGHKIIHLTAETSRSPGLAGRLSYQFYGLAQAGLESAEEITGEPPVKSVAIGVHPFSKAGFPVDPGLALPDKVDQLTKARHRFASAWQKEWRDNDLDVVLAPGSNTTAVPHDTYGCPVYTMIWNLLDVSICILGNIGYTS